MSRNVFRRCHCRQQRGEKKRKKSYSDVCPPKSDTDAANSFGVVTQASSQGDEALPWPNERVLLPGQNTPAHPHLASPPLPGGVGAGSWFTQGEQARQRRDKQSGLNKAFRCKGRVTCLSSLSGPPLPLARPLPRRQPLLHSSIMADRCQARPETC